MWPNYPGADVGGWFVEDGKEMYSEVYNARAEPVFCQLKLLFSDACCRRRRRSLRSPT